MVGEMLCKAACLKGQSIDCTSRHLGSIHCIALHSMDHHNIMLQMGLVSEEQLLVTFLTYLYLYT